MRREGVVHSSRAAVAQSSGVQIFSSILLAVILPVFLRYPDLVLGEADKGPLQTSIVGGMIGALGGLALFRRVTAFPGVNVFGYIMPSYAMSYGFVALIMFYLRLDYSRFYLGMSFSLALATAYTLTFVAERYARRRIWVVPDGDIASLAEVEGVDWIMMIEPVLPPPHTPIVADLHHDHAPAWERTLAEAAINGHAVYHVKQLRESLTGRVSIDHLSENSFGSLIPNLAYRNVKRAFDVVTCLLLLPVLILPLCVIGIMIKLDSPGPIFFAHGRMGYRNRPFRMLKFRTMRERLPGSDDDDARQVAMTLPDDDRITRVGRFIRRTRLDELPQIINVLRGEMSLIGPRPEALALAQWYEEEIPFYAYRHIVRPGITGWAQVRQGHVIDLDSAHQKLNYDFFYIKNFSAWLDILIALRTPRIMISGFGSK